MIQIAVFGNCFQADKGTQIKHVFRMLDKIEAQVWIDTDFYNFLVDDTGISPSYQGLITTNDFNADIALSIGGDGTFLRTAERVGDKGIPILGINTGRLGFLADVPAHDIDNALTEIYKNNYRVEERSLLQLSISGFEEPYMSCALNEIAILKRDNSSMITLHVDIDQEYLNSYEADGLIIATPTGSTGYSLSVGGPIIAPQANNFVISPVAPHSLTTRPLVITDTCELDIEVHSRTDAFQVAVDGNSYTLTTANRLRIKKAPYQIRVVKRPGHTFYQTLRDKLMWGADKRV
ncbi:MAG: NAD kinase [Bacteroidales bacterium]